jgi:drug/metabolite transporter (DMT)-like permease
MVIFNPFAHISNGESFNWYLILPLIGACANCLNWVYLHEMRDQFKEIVVLEYTYVSHLITSSLVAIFVGSMQDEAQFGGHEIFLDPSFYGQVIGMVLFAYLAHILRIKATFLRKPSEILAFNYIGLIYSILIDVLYYHTHLSLTTILGIALTSAGLMSKLVMDLCGRQEQAGPVVPPSK